MRFVPLSLWGAALLAPLLAFAGEKGAPLVEAARVMDRDAVRGLIGASADVDAALSDGMTALHWAARNNDLETAALLLEAGADAGAANRYGVTPLTLACTNGSALMVEALLDAGADPNTALPGGETVLMTASRTGRLEPVKMLLVRGADPHARVHGMGRQEGAGANAFLNRMRDPTNFDYVTKSDQTALFWAAAEGHAEVVAELIEFGADFRRTLESGFTPLLFAARAGHLDVVRTLIAAGADASERIDPSPDWRLVGYGAKLRPGATALHVAAENGNFELAAFLLDAGVDPNIEGAMGYRALHAIANARRIPPGDANPPPRITGDVTSLEFVRMLAEHGADLDARMTGAGLLNLGNRVLGPTAFLAAVQTADMGFMKTLVDLGADPSLTGGGGRTALMLAGARTGTEREVVQVMEFLLDLGIDIDAVNDNGETAMHAVAYRDRVEPVKFLAARGASVELWNRPNRYGSTPLMIASGYQGSRTIRPSPRAAAAIREAMIEAGLSPGVTPVTEATAAKNVY